MGTDSLDADLTVNGQGWNRPQVFKGSPEERRTNYQSHRWMQDRYGPDEFDVEVYCDDCCAKPWHTAASWPCGAKIPREIVHYNRDGSYARCEDDDAF